MQNFILLNARTMHGIELGILEREQLLRERADERCLLLCGETILHEMHSCKDMRGHSSCESLGMAKNIDDATMGTSSE